MEKILFTLSFGRLGKSSVDWLLMRVELLLVEIIRLLFWTSRLIWSLPERLDKNY